VNILIRVLTFVLFYVLGSKGMAFIGVGAAAQLIVGLVAGFFAAVAIGDKLANNRRKNAPGVPKQGKWDR
jgi:hypothetical protein